MYGVPMGGPSGRIISGVMAECRNIIIAVGQEMLIPGSLPDIIQKPVAKVSTAPWAWPQG